MIDIERVQRRLDDLGLTAFSAARQAGLAGGYVHDLLRGKINEPGSAKLAALSKVLRCSPDYLLGLVERPGSPPGTIRPSAMTAVVDMPIRYEAGAGLWVAADEPTDGPLGSAPVALAPHYAAHNQWLERVRGDSMNRLLPDGALVHVIDAIELGYTPRNEDLVIVCRSRAQGAFIERSVKQVAVGPDGVQLWPRSHNPRWDSPLALVEGVREGEDVDVTIVGKVVRAYITFGSGSDF